MHLPQVLWKKIHFSILYVDDILLASNDKSFLHEIKNFLSKNFEKKDLGDASFVLSIKIHQDRSRGILGLSQKSCIERYDMQSCKPGDTSSVPQE